MVSRDADPQQRLWLSLGYGGKNSSPGSWRYWKKPNAKREWIIAAPNGLAEFELHHRTVFYEGEELFTKPTQWRATWCALGYFYEHIIPTVTPPPKA